MSTEREKHIQKLMERAQEEKRPQQNLSPRNRRKVRDVKTSSGKPSQSRSAAASRTTTQSVSVSRPVQSSRNGSSTEKQPSARPSARAAQPAHRLGGATERAKPQDRITYKPKPVKTKPVKKVKPVKVKTPKPKPADGTYPDRYIWISLLLLFIAGYLLISCTSYMVHWSADQSIADWDNLFRNVRQDALNWGGRIGAILSSYIVRKWFGIFGLLLPVSILIIAIKVLRIPNFKMHRGVSSSILLMLVGSLALGHLAGRDPGIFGSGLGGEMGIYSAEWLQAMIGFEGTSLLIVVVVVGSVYFTCSLAIRNLIKNISATIEKIKEKQRLRREEQRLRHEAMIAAAAERAARGELTGAQPALPAVIASEATDQPEKSDKQETDGQPLSADQPDGFGQPENADKTDEYFPENPFIDPGQEYVYAEPYVPQNENVFYMEDGKLGYLAGYDYEDRPVVYYFDSPQAVFFAASDGEEPHGNIEFTVKDRTEEPVAAEDTLPGYEQPQQPQEEDSAARKVVHFAPSKDDPNFIVEQLESEEEVDDDTINLSELYDPTLELSDYQKPPVELLADHSRRVSVGEEELVENKNRIVGTLENFGIKIDTIEATIGPTVTLYEIVPAPGVRISKIKNLEDDIALSLSALGIRIIAPIPGKGTIGIEVPNKDKEVVSMYSVIKSAKFHDSDADLPVALGKTIQNETFVLDLAKMPHLLVAGATGQGKSVGLNAIITSLLYKKHPAELKFILVDPKKVELTLYSRLEKHFLAKLPDAEEPIITDTQKVVYTFNSICIEMDSRYDLLKAAKVRNIKEYNEKFINRRLNPNKGHRYLPYFVVIVDEFADLIMTAGREIETPIARIAQLARAVGIHLIIATQRPTTNIITGVIKANFPARIAFRVTSMIDSRTILDQPGANQLVGRGDMLISTGSEITRVQCAFIDTPEVQMITDHIGNQRGYVAPYELPEYVPEGENGPAMSGDLSNRDSLFDEVARYVVSNQSGSASTIQRKFSIGFNRAGRIVDQLEAAGILGHSEGSKPRQVLIQDPISLDNILDNLH